MSLNNSKRSIQSASNSDTSPIKKKTKIALKRNITHSSSSDDIDIPVSSTVSTTAKQQTSLSRTNQTSPSTLAQVPSASTRIQIQRSSSSSSDDSNGSEEIVTKKKSKTT